MNKHKFDFHIHVRKLVDIVLMICLISSALFLDAGFANAAPLKAPSSAPFTDCASVTEIPQAECEALVALYNSTGGANWTTNTDWLQTDTPCSWYGIYCVSGNVSNVFLPSNNLTGTIPVAIENLTHMRVLSLSVNNLTGALPQEIGNLTALEYLWLNTNSFSGSIPATFGGLSSIRHLILETNLLSGPIPASLGNLPNLENLNLSNNQLTGPIPDELTLVTSLQELWLFSNQLSGTIPDGITTLTNLTKLGLFNNQITGNLPAEIGNLVNLTHLTTYGNQMSGEVPASITSLVNLEEFGLNCGHTSTNPDVIAFLNNINPYWDCSNIRFHAQIVQNNVVGMDFPIGTEVTLTIDDPSNGPGVDFTDTQTAVSQPLSWDPDFTTARFNDLGGLTLSSGMLLTMTGGGYARIHTITNLVVSGVDPDTDRVWGTGTPGANIGVQYCDSNSGCLWKRFVTVQPDNTWEVDFSVFGGSTPEEQNILDITPNMPYNGEALQSEGGGITDYAWNIGSGGGGGPALAARLTRNAVDAWEWPEGTPLALSIDDPNTGQNPDYFNDTLTAVLNDPLDPSQGTSAYFSFGNTYTLKPGDEVSVTGGGTTVTMNVADIHIADVDVEGNTISGTAGNGISSISVRLWSSPTDVVVTANVVNNAWTADFSGIYDLGAGDEGVARWWDVNGNMTSDYFSIPNPSFDVRANDDLVELYEWTLNHTVTVDIDDPSDGTGDVDFSDSVLVDSYADWDPNITYAFIDFAGTIDIQPGFIITAHDGTITKTHTVTSLEITNVNIGNDTVTGTAALNSPVDLWACDNNNNCVNRHVQADGYGNWTADFSQVGTQPDEQYLFNIIVGTWIDSEQRDDDNDKTMFGLNAPAPQCQSGNTVSGTVYEHNGITPVPAVRIRVEDYATGEILFLTETGSNGTFGCFLPNGSYRIHASRDVYSMEYYNEAVDENATQVQITSGAQLTNIDFTISPLPFVEQLTFNLENVLLQDPAVRQAIALGTDRQRIAAQAFLPNGLFGTPLDSIVPPEHWVGAPSSELTIYPFDLAQARALLAAAGWVDTDADGYRENAQNAELAFDFYTSNLSFRIASAAIFQQNMAAIGIRIAVQNVPPEELFGLNGILDRGEFDISEFAWGGDYDNEPNLIAYRSTHAQNYGSYNQPTFDAAFGNARAESNMPDKLPHLYEAQAILASELPVVPLFSRYSVEAVNTPAGINVSVSPAGFLTMQFASVSQGGVSGVVNASVHTADLPDGFQILGIPYEIGTSAVYTTALVCLDFDDAGLTAAQESAIRLFHRDDHIWVDVTDVGFPDTVADKVCGTVSHLSPFAVMYSAQDSDNDGIPDLVDSCPSDSTNTCNASGSASTVMDSSGGTLTTPDNDTEIVVPENALTEPTTLTVTDGGGGFSVTTDQGEMEAVMTKTIGPEGTTFAVPVTITLAWLDANNDGIVDGTAINETDLHVSKDGLLIAGPCSGNPGCDPVSNTFSVQVSSLSYFALGSPPNQAPVVDAASFSVTQVAGNGTFVGTVTFTDADAGQGHSCSIRDGNVADAFAIHSGTCVISVNNASSLDYATRPAYSLTVRVTDDGTPVRHGEAQITINVLPVFPVVEDILRADPTPSNAASVAFTVTFSKNVTGVNSADFEIASLGLTGAGISGVTGGGAVYIVTVNTGTGDGTLGLNLVDNDTIIDADTVPLGGTGGSNGNFTGQTYTIDKTPPDTQITAQPGTPTNSTAASFSFNSPDGTASFECSLDGGAYAACLSPKNYSSLTQGSHTFTVRAKDNAGNRDSTPASHTWTVDLTPPNTLITVKPGNSANSDTAAFEFTSTKANSQFQCQLDGGGYSPCTSPVQFNGLEQGLHTFYVRATDDSGNTDPSPASHAWTVDLEAPVVSIISAPSNPSGPSVAFAFSSPDNTASFFCKLDDGSYSACASPIEYSGLAGGSHTFNLRAVDPAGNYSADAGFTWSVDATGPGTSISAFPSNPSNSRSISFGFDSDEVTSTFECKLDGQSFAACTSPQSYTGLGDGSHTFQVRAVDTFGNRDETPAEYTWTITPANSIIKSTGLNDGWILESTETSNTGGTMNSTASTINLGDDAADKQYRAILHFDTSPLPDNAVITSATLQLKKQGTSGTNPFTILGSLRVDTRKPDFGLPTLELTDFKASAAKNNIATFNPTPVGPWYSAVFNSTGRLYINRTGTTQFKIYFTIGDNDDLGADLIKFYSGNASAASRPKLIVEYYVP